MILEASCQGDLADQQSTRGGFNGEAITDLTKCCRDNLTTFSTLLTCAALREAMAAGDQLVKLVTMSCANCCRDLTSATSEDTMAATRSGSEEVKSVVTHSSSSLLASSSRIDTLRKG